MFQNMKVDIVYYKTNSDFEMEFNLCGCCRMRLLTDKATDRKVMVHALARAVSRSRIIMVVGPLFGDEGSIATTASAIGSGLDKVDNKLYGIRTDAPINIIAGATPLVTSDGFFGGCIIERGPQTMILLSESRTVRKTVVENLIHPYISELYAMELKSKAESIIENNNEATDNQKILNDTEENLPEAQTEESSAIFGAAVPVVSPEIPIANAAVTAALAADKVAEAIDLVTDAVTATDTDKAAEKDEVGELFTEFDEPENIPQSNDEEIVLITDDEELTDENETKMELIDEVFEEDEYDEPLSDDIQLIDDVDTTYEEDTTDEDIELIESNVGDTDPVPFEIATLIYEENQSPEEIEGIEDISSGIITEFEGGEVEEDYFYAPETDRELVSIVPEIEPEEITPENIKFTQDDEIFDEDDSIAKKISSLNIPIMILTALLFVLIAAICLIIFVYPKSDGSNPAEYIKAIFETLFK